MNKLQKNNNKGMTYVELIVVLGIFVLLSAISIVNYRKFQSQIEIKTLANDVALQLVEVQKSASSGKWNVSASDNWKPSYGLYFNRSTATQILPFVDLDQDKFFTNNGLESLDALNIKKGNYVSSLVVFYQNGNSNTLNQDLHITFTRPDEGATFRSSAGEIDPGSPVSYIVITLSSSSGISSVVKLYASGRIQLN